MQRAQGAAAALLLALLAAALTHSVRADEDDQSPLQVARGRGLTAFIDAATAAGLGPTLDNRRLKATLFIPTNSAFASTLAALGQPSVQALAAANPGLLLAVLQHHVIPGATIEADDLEDRDPYATLLPNQRLGAGSTCTCSRSNCRGAGCSRTYTVTSAGGVTANIVTRDVESDEAEIHIIDKVLLPDLARITPAPPSPPHMSSRTLSQAAARAPGLTVFSAALKATGLDTALTDPDIPYTILAPTDAAFQALLASLGRTPEQLLADTPLVTRVLSLHVLPQVANARELVTRAAAGGASARLTTMLFGRLLTVSRVPGSTTLRFNSSATTSARVVAADLVAGAGLVHTIDAVLLP